MLKSKKSKMTIIGGSIAGLEAAIQLSKYYDVTLYEEHDVIGEPLRCAEGWFIHNGIEPYDHIVRTIDAIRFRRIDIKDFKVKDTVTFNTYGRLKIIDRPEMEREMARIAVEKGCSIITGKRVKIRDVAHWSDIIVDASGWPSQWVREFYRHRRRGAVAIEVLAKYRGDEDSIIVDISREFDGYFWVFPSREGLANIGVGYWRKRLPGMKEYLKKYLNKLGAKPVRWTGGTLGCVMNRPFVRYYNSTPVALVGDAAGLVDPFFAEGMTKAVLSARILAKHIRSGTVQEYEKEYLNTLRAHYLSSKILYVFKQLMPHSILFKLLRICQPVLGKR